MSSGFWKLPPMMLKKLDNSSYDCSLSRPTSNPSPTNASVIETDCPPVIAIRAIRLPVEGLASSSTFTASTVSSRLFVEIAPHCRMIPRQTAWGEASEPVCDIVARAPASVWPPFHTTTGLRAVAARSAFTKRGPSFTPSTYIAMTSVSGSSVRYSR